MKNKICASGSPFHEIRKNHFFLILSAICIIGTVIFSIMDELKNHHLDLGIDLFVLALFAGCLISLRKGYFLQTYTVFTVLISLALLLNIAADRNNPTALYWLFPMPILAFFFLGRNIGGIITFIITLCMGIMMLIPDFFNARIYDGSLLLRFGITFVLMVILAWRFETGRIWYEKKLIQQRDLMKEQKDFLETLLETLPSPVFFKDVNGRFLGCNRSFEKLINLPREAIIGKTVYDIAPKSIADKYHEKDRELFNSPGTQTYDWVIKSSDIKQAIFNKSTYTNKDGSVIGIIGAVTDITEMKESEAQKEKLILELETALKEVKTLSGLLPICSYCKKIRDDQGYWNRIEGYIQNHSDALFSHGICPDCETKLYEQDPWFKEP